MNARVCRGLVCVPTLLVLCATCLGGESAQRVKLFEAIRYGQVKAAVIAKGHSRLVLLLENKLAKPLAIEPQLLAVVPASRIARQPGGSESSSGDKLRESTPKSPQSLASVFSEQYAKLGIRRQRGEETPSAFMIPGKSKRRLELPCFCMEHGNPDPNPRIAYRLCPIDMLKPKPATDKLLQQYLRGAIAQRPLQLAIWHVENEVSWRKLSQLTQRSTRRSARYSVAELRQATRIVQQP